MGKGFALSSLNGLGDREDTVKVRGKSRRAWRQALLGASIMEAALFVSLFPLFEKDWYTAVKCWLGRRFFFLIFFLLDLKLFNDSH